MKNKLFLLSIIILGFSVTITNAQMMWGGAGGTSIPATSEEIAGKAILDKLKSGEINCSKLVDNDFEFLGEYFMGSMMGSSHENMNDRLKQSLGEAGEVNMHISLGKRMSGCDTSAEYPAGFSGFSPMMGGYRNQGQGTFGDNKFNMMGFGNGFYGFGWIFMVVLWALIIASFVLVIKKIAFPSGNHSSRSAIHILKERLARGEINKKEFEEIKKDLM